MPENIKSSKTTCAKCAEGTELDFDFTMAFQPIVNIKTETVFGYEALVRGLNNEPAYEIIAKVDDDNRYAFDQTCRIKAISLAAKLNLDCMLSINFLPGAIYKPERCIRTTLETAKEHSFPTENIIFEFIESEKIIDPSHTKAIVNYYRKLGFKTAVDDFGAAHSNLDLLVEFQTNIVKLDMALIRGINEDPIRQTIVKHTLAMFKELNITNIAEGIETQEEADWLRKAGVELMQGYFFAKPGFEHLPSVTF